MAVRGDYYEVLGVAREADAETIKSAFRQLARRYHPDVSKEPDAEQRFREIAEAYGVLSDPARRADYDAQGQAGVAGATAEDLWSGIDFADIFGSGAAAFGGLFGRLFGQATAGPQPGDDVRLDLSVSLDEVFTGGDHVVTIARPGPCPQCRGRGTRPGTSPRRCPRCNGTGRRAVTGRHGLVLVHEMIACPECAGRGCVIDQPCPACAGSGRTVRNETIDVHIPPGVAEGATLRLAGQGLRSPMPGGPAGDAYVSIRSRPDPRFSRVDADLWHDLHIDAIDAALGVTTVIPVPGGQVRVRIPPGIQSGSELRVPGQGLPRYGEDGRGSLHLRVIPVIPRRLSSCQRQLYEQLRAEGAGSGGATVRSGAPDAPRAGSMIGVTPAGPPATSRGPLIVASVLLLVGAVLDLVGGVAVLGGSHLATGAQYGSGIPHIWGWVMVVVGAVQLLGGAAVVRAGKVRANG